MKSGWTLHPRRRSYKPGWAEQLWGKADRVTSLVDLSTRQDAGCHNSSVHESDPAGLDLRSELQLDV